MGKMKATFYVDLPVEDVIVKVRDFLVSNDFVYSEEENTYVVTCGNKRVEKSRDSITFWSMKLLDNRSDNQEARHPRRYSIEIRGAVRRNGSESAIELEILEYHATRLHIYGGAGAVVEYFNSFCNIFEK